MRETHLGLAAIVCISLLSTAYGQTTTTTRTSNGGYFVQFGKEGATPIRPNLIPAPAAPTPIASTPAAPIPVPNGRLPAEPVRIDRAPKAEGMAWNATQPKRPLLAMPPLPASIESSPETAVQPSAPTPLELSPPVITAAEPTLAEPTPAEPTPAEPTPAEPTPAEPTPAEPTPAEPTPAEPTPAEPTPEERQLAPAALPSAISATDASAPSKAAHDATRSPGDEVRLAKQQPISKATIEQPLPSRLPNKPDKIDQDHNETDNPLETPIQAPATYSVSSLIHGCKDCDVGCEPLCCGSTWEHSTTVWAAALYMRPRNADVPFAVPIDGPIGSILANPIQTGAVALLDPDYEVGYTVGFDLALNALTSISLEYLSLDSSTANQVSTSAPNVLRSLVSHPSSTSAAADFLSAEATLGIDLQTLDLSLRHLFVGGDVFAVNYFAGVRYARLEQNFHSTFFDNGTETVDSQVDFDGAGLRLGLETERRACNHCIHLYGRTAASFLAGRFQTNYFQGQTFDPTVVSTSWEAGRIVPILDLEVGGGWSSKCGRFKLSAGYVFSAWFNTIKTDDFIQAVQQNDFHSLSNTLTFDGIVARAEYCF